MRPDPIIAPSAVPVLDGLAAHIDLLLDAQYDEMTTHRWEAPAGSPREKARAKLRRHYGPGGDWDGEEALRAGIASTLLLAAAAQDLEGIRSLLLDRHVVVPIAPLSRAALEITGQVFWLLDPRIKSPRDFAARWWMTRLDDATRQVTTALAVGKDNKTIDRLVARKKHIRNAEIPNRFYPSETHNVDGKVTLRGQHLPGLSGSLKYIASVMKVDDGFPGMYAQLSDATHPTVYSAFQRVVYDPTGGDMHQIGSYDLRREYDIVRTAIVAFQYAWYLTTLYHGHNIDDLRRVCHQVDNLLQP